MTLTAPATSPLRAAIRTGSPPDACRVRLLSAAHARHAATMRTAGSRAIAGGGQREGERARADGGHAEGDPRVDVLAEHDPGDERGEDALEAQQQPGLRRVAGGEPGHEQDGSDHAAGEDGRAQPGPVRAAEALRAAARSAAQQAVDAQARRRRRGTGVRRGAMGSARARRCFAAGTLIPKQDGGAEGRGDAGRAAPGPAAELMTRAACGNRRGPLRSHRSEQSLENDHSDRAGPSSQGIRGLSRLDDAAGRPARTRRTAAGGERFTSAPVGRARGAVEPAGSTVDRDRGRLLAWRRRERSGGRCPAGTAPLTPTAPTTWPACDYRHRAPAEHELVALQARDVPGEELPGATEPRLEVVGGGAEAPRRRWPWPGRSPGVTQSAPSIRWQATRCPASSTTATATRKPSSSGLATPRRMQAERLLEAQRHAGSPPTTPPEPARGPRPVTARPRTRRPRRSAPGSWAPRTPAAGTGTGPCARRRASRGAGRRA